MKTINTVNKVLPILVLGDTGKSGRRIASRILDKNLPLRRGSRSSTPAFHWEHPEEWSRLLSGVGSIYVTYPQDLPIEHATRDIAELIKCCKDHGVSKFVLLTGRGEGEADKQIHMLKESGLEWTVIRSAWFSQNFTEGAFAEMTEEGVLVLPENRAPEPFVDLDDVADVVVAALTLPGHSGKVYDVTGPELLTFEQVAEGLSKALRKPIRCESIPYKAFIQDFIDVGLSRQDIELLSFLFSELLDGRNAKLGDGIQQALGRMPRKLETMSVSDDASVSPHHNRDILHRFVGEFINGGNEDILHELLHDDYVYQSPEETLQGRESIAAMFRGLRGAFPDMSLTVHDIRAEHDRTAMDFTLTGTHHGDFMGLHATGNSLGVRGVIFTRFRDGKIVQEWELLDIPGLMQQLEVSEN